MKKILFATLAVAAIASCAKTEPTYVEADSEIRLNPVTTVATKANQLKAITGTQYPAAEAFDVYAYWINDAGVKSADYLTAGTSGVEFVNKGTYWGGTTTYYWPKNGSLRFAAYSPSSLDMTHEYEDDTYKLDNHVYPGDVDAATYTSKTYDILVAKTSEPYTAETGASKVSVKFEHALSWVTFKLQSTEVANNAFTVEKVVVNDAAKKGTLVANMTADTKTWSDLDNKSAIEVFTGSYTVTSNAAVQENVGNGLLVLPQAPTTVTVYYTQNALEGTPALADQKITVPLVLDKAEDKWEPGKHYTYTVLFDLDEILINPTVEDWEETTEVIVNSDPVEVATSAELVAAMAEGKDVVLTQNITLDEPVVVAPVETKAGEATVEVTIDLNGNDIIAPLFAESNGAVNVGTTDSYAFWVKEGGKLTINGNGNVTTQACTYSIAVWAQGGEVVINGGTYANAGEGSDLIYASAGGKVTINGGTFKANKKEAGVVGNNNEYSALNLKDNTGSTIIVYGGTFYNFNPADNLSEGPGTNFVAPGYASTETETGVWTVAPAAPTEVTTAAELAEVVGNGGTAVLANDITLSEILVMSYDAVLDGNGYTLTSSAARAINVVEGKNVTIKNLNIVASGERAINVITNTKSVKVENVTAKAANYTINIAASAPNANVNVVNSDLTGLNTVNVASEGAVVNLVNTKITCDDQNENESYGAISIDKVGKNAKVTATDCETVVNGDSCAGKHSAEGSSISFVNCTGRTDIKDRYFAIEYGNYNYTFETFAEALEKAKDGETIILTQNLTTDATLKVTGKKVTLDLNGKTLTVTNPGVDYTDGIKATTGADLTITGNGTVIADWGAIVAMKDAKVVVENGTFYGNESEVVFAQNEASVEILGGKYMQNEDPSITLNLLDDHRDTASIVVYGGSFFKFNPADNANEGAGTNFVAEGKTVTADGDWYVVK